MSTIQQSCPQCSRMLELPADGVGRMAQCPACSATFRIGESQSSGAHPAGSTTHDGSPFSLDAQSRESTKPENPYQSPSIDPSGYPVVTSGPLSIATCTIDDIIPVTKDIFVQRWGASVAACAIAAAGLIAAIGLPMLLIGLIGQFISPTLAAVGGVLTIPLIFVASMYAMIGVGRAHLAIARDEPSPLRSLVCPMGLVIRGLGSYVILAVGFLAAAFVAALLVRLAAMGGESLMAVVGVLVITILSVAMMLAQWLLWSWMMVCSDGKTTAMGTIRAAYNITMQNKLTSFFLILISIALSMLGSLMCYVGHIVTAPVTILMFAVAYLMMTNQTVSDPKQTTRIS